MKARPLKHALGCCCLCMLLACGRVGFPAQPIDADAENDGGACVDSDADGRCDGDDLCPDADDNDDADGDGFPDACDRCGDGALDTTAGETCDPGLPGTECPESCDDAVACTADSLLGSALACDVVCTNLPITAPFNDDACCPPGANNTNDSDCAPECGNGAVEAGESCDPSSEMACPESCDDADPCTIDALEGDPDACDATCSQTPVTELMPGDSCCPPDANNTTDSDCSPLCGNGTIEAGETCDPQATCPTACDDSDPCTQDLASGAPQNCDTACASLPVEVPFNGDGCCPPGADSTNDSECPPECGNSVLELGEECDGGSQCMANCTFTPRGRCLAGLAQLPEAGLGDDPCSQCACSMCTTRMLDCYVNGNAQRDMYCPPAVECALEEACVGDCDSAFKCFGEFCWWGGDYPNSATGPCKNQLSAAAGGTTDPATALDRAGDPAYPAYWAERFASCLQDRCPSSCTL
jgi:hypothetical protein